MLALLSAVLSVTLALSLVSARQALERRRGAGVAGWLEKATGTGAGFVLVVPPIVIGAGWFVALRHTDYLFAAAPVMVVDGQRRHGDALCHSRDPAGARRGGASATTACARSSASRDGRGCG